jgi:CRP/FNR family cyclic AMP-dependent transcriptional regulator
MRNFLRSKGEMDMETTEEILFALHKVPWFNTLTPEHLNKMAELAHLRQAKAGEIFFREGDKQDFVYVVLDGRVSLEISVPHHGKMRFCTAEPHDVFGWSGVTPGMRQRTAGAVAVLDSTVICFDAEKLRQLADNDHDFGYLLMRRLANVVASRLMVTRLQLIDMFAGPVETRNE